MDGLKKTTREYMISTLFLTLSMYVGTFTVNMESYGMISASFHILCSAAYIGGWQVLARRSPETLPKYYLVFHRVHHLLSRHARIRCNILC